MKTKIVIECRGGVIAAIYCDSANIEATLVDWDNIDAGDSPRALPVQIFENMPADTQLTLTKT